MAKFGGAVSDKKPTEQRVDTRRLSIRLKESWASPDGAFMLVMYLWGTLLLSLALPLGVLLTVIPIKLFSKWFLHPLDVLHNLPYRVPKKLAAPDGSIHVPDKPFKKNKHLYKPKGVTLYGQDRVSGLQVWGTGNDDTTHGVVLGTTGSGKTELIFGFIFNQLIHDSGFIAIDAKGDISFQILE